MMIYGLDFTSAPSPRKPMACAHLHLEGARLVLDSLEGFYDWVGFERFLQREGEWLAGIDFPFGQPAHFIQALGWGATWAAYVGRIAQMSAAEWATTVKRYREGDQVQQRRVEALAHSLSPMNVDPTLFYQGAPRLLASGVNLPGLHPTQAKRTALEAYPKLVVKALLGAGQPSKAESHPPHHAQRLALWSALQGPPAERVYGLRLVIPRPLQALAQQILNDESGASLAAVLAGVQAAWVGRQPRYGQPLSVNRLEGWIADPYLKDS